jgi:hypothetical protein
MPSLRGPSATRFAKRVGAMSWRGSEKNRKRTPVRRNISVRPHQAEIRYRANRLDGEMSDETRLRIGDAICGTEGPPVHTRVVSNAKGYGPWTPPHRVWDNPKFDPNFVIEIWQAHSINDSPPHSIVGKQSATDHR